MVRAVHTNIEGRGRFSVEGLKGSEMLKHWLEERLVKKHGMLRASANTVTGNILVVFDPKKDHEIIVESHQACHHAVPRSRCAPGPRTGIKIPGKGDGTC